MPPAMAARISGSAAGFRVGASACGSDAHEFASNVRLRRGNSTPVELSSPLSHAAALGGNRGPLLRVWMFSRVQVAAEAINKGGSSEESSEASSEGSFEESFEESLEHSLEEHARSHGRTALTGGGVLCARSTSAVTPTARRLAPSTAGSASSAGSTSEEAPAIGRSARSSTEAWSSLSMPRRWGRHQAPAAVAITPAAATRKSSGTRNR